MNAQMHFIANWLNLSDVSCKDAMYMMYELFVTSASSTYGVNAYRMPQHYLTSGIYWNSKTGVFEIANQYHTNRRLLADCEAIAPQTKIAG